MNYIARPSSKPGLPAETHKTFQIPIQFHPKKKHVLINQDWNFPLTDSKTNIKDWKYKEPTEEDRKKNTNTEDATTTSREEQQTWKTTADPEELFLDPDTAQNKKTPTTTRSRTSSQASTKMPIPLKESIFTA